jgi:hypothetical protein
MVKNMQRCLCAISLALGFMLATRTARADTISFTAIPNDVSGPAGSTVGWGFSIVNGSSADYLDLTAIDSTLFLSTNGTPDASIFTFPNVAAGQTIIQPYDPTNSLGLFQFTWNPGVPAGTTETGNFTLFGAFCAPSDPFCAEDGSVSSTALASAPYSATVMSSSPTPVPEPSSLLLLFSGLCGIGLWTRRYVVPRSSRSRIARMS